MAKDTQTLLVEKIVEVVELQELVEAMIAGFDKLKLENEKVKLENEKLKNENEELGSCFLKATGIINHWKDTGRKLLNLINRHHGVIYNHLKDREKLGLTGTIPGLDDSVECFCRCHEDCVENYMKCNRSNILTFIKKKDLRLKEKHKEIDNTRVQCKGGCGGCEGCGR